MKKLYLLQLALFSLLTFLVVGCRAEDDLIQNAKHNKNFSATISYNKIAELPEVIPSVEKIKKQIKNIDGKSIEGFDIDTTNIIKFESETNTLYSFLVNTDINTNQPYYVENLNLFQTEYQQLWYITRYIPDNGRPFYSYADFVGDVKFYDTSGNFLYSSRQTNPTGNYFPFSLGCWGYVLTDFSGNWTIYSAEWICSGSPGGGSGGGNTGNGGNNGGGTSGGSGNTGTGTGNGGSGGGVEGPGGDVPIPNIPTENFQEQRKYEAFINSLNSQQYQFLGEQPYYNGQVFKYIKSKNFDESSKQLMSSAINFFIINTNSNGVNVSWEQFQNWFIDDNNISPIELDNFLADLNNPNIVKPTRRFKNNIRLNCIFNKAKNSANFNQYLENFDSRFSVAHLLFDVTALANSTANAQTSPPDGYWIKIDINSNNLNRPTLDIARTFMHEIIHAEMFRVLLSLASTSNGQLSVSEITTLLNSNNYPGIYDYFRRFGLNNMQHEQMAAHYRGIIKNFLKQIDSSITDSQAESMAWVGLQGTVAWNNLGTINQNSILNTYNNWYNSATQNCP